MQGSSHFNLWLVLRGHGTLALNGVEYPLRPGIGFLFRPDDTINAAAMGTDPFQNAAMHFLLPQSETDSAKIKASRGVEVPQLGLYQELLDYSLNLNMNQADDVALRERLAREMLAIFLRDARNPIRDPLDRAIRQQMQRIIYDPGSAPEVDELASEMALSRAQYHRRFHAIAKTSPKQFILGQRITRATHLLRDTSASLQSVADALGYRDVFFFSRQFKLKAGMAPSQYRKLHANPQRDRQMMT